MFCGGSGSVRLFPNRARSRGTLGDERDFPVQDSWRPHPDASTQPQKGDRPPIEMPTES